MLCLLPASTRALLPSPSKMCLHHFTSPRLLMYLKYTYNNVGYPFRIPRALLLLFWHCVTVLPCQHPTPKFAYVFTLLQILPCVLLLPLPPTIIDPSMFPHTTSEGYGASTCMRQTVAGMKMYPTGSMHLRCWIAKNNLVFHP